MHKYRVWKAAIQLTEYMKMRPALKHTQKNGKKKKKREKSLKNYKEG